MLIDWFTVSAQALNFMILIWLLKRFLYRPILDAVDAREKRIATSLADTTATQIQAQQQHADYQHKNKEFEQHRATLLGQAIKEADTERLRLLEEASKQAATLTAARELALQDELRGLGQSIRARTQQEVFAIARKILEQLATTSLEERISAVFTRRLQNICDKDKLAFAQALQPGPAAAQIRSAFELPAAQQAVIRSAVNETFSADVQLQFDTRPDLVSGIELTSNGQRISWNIEDYLASLERSVTQLLHQNETPGTPAPAAP